MSAICYSIQSQWRFRRDFVDSGNIPPRPKASRLETTLLTYLMTLHSCTAWEAPVQSNSKTKCIILQAKGIISQFRKSIVIYCPIFRLRKYTISSQPQKPASVFGEAFSDLTLLESLGGFGRIKNSKFLVSLVHPSIMLRLGQNSVLICTWRYKQGAFCVL